MLDIKPTGPDPRNGLGDKRCGGKQGFKDGLARCFLYHLSYQGSPRILEWVAYPFFRGSSDPGIELGSPTLRTDSLPSEPPDEVTGRF